MFGLFKSKPVSYGPIPFDFEIIIERPVAEVYPLIDWADPRNAKRQLGHVVEGSAPDFVLRLAAMPDHRFMMTVTEAVVNLAYAFSCDIQPRVGRLEASHERYSFETTEEGHCFLRLMNEVTFVEGLTASQMEHELMVMSIATNDALMKYKVLAEMGIDAAKSVEHQSFS